MLRTELLTAVKLLRDILKLNEVEENPEKKEIVLGGKFT
jgi:hypothetical protein